MTRRTCHNTLGPPPSYRYGLSIYGVRHEKESVACTVAGGGGGGKGA
ncbi:hypothetical protein AG1IA_00810 [Rhizoctonia solani AG-1 IA]|uniref:Uncharacterized protein n=1 Tax=Thanatephorus cucumeris (strain AG1-IA) TaxID=983506 RepID=L8X931_THACA|nr:hypothetical protein AG1IA_00810 [Rhizoctonia solani AG-1 IA]